eukprot:136618-Prymnesium_polylepis.1
MIGARRDIFAPRRAGHDDDLDSRRPDQARAARRRHGRRRHGRASAAGGGRADDAADGRRGPRDRGAAGGGGEGVAHDLRRDGQPARERPLWTVQIPRLWS